AGNPLYRAQSQIGPLYHLLPLYRQLTLMWKRYKASIFGSDLVCTLGSNASSSSIRRRNREIAALICEGERRGASGGGEYLLAMRRTRGAGNVGAPPARAADIGNCSAWFDDRPWLPLVVRGSTGETPKRRANQCATTLELGGDSLCLRMRVSHQHSRVSVAADGGDFRHVQTFLEEPAN